MIGGDTFRVAIVGATVTSGGEPVVTDLNNGKYSVSYTAYGDGTFTVAVFFTDGKTKEEAEVGAQVLAMGNGRMSPYSVVAYPGAISTASKSTGAGLTHATAGVQAVFQIQAFDAFSQRVVCLDYVASHLVAGERCAAQHDADVATQFRAEVKWAGDVASYPDFVPTVKVTAKGAGLYTATYTGIISGRALGRVYVLPHSTVAPPHNIITGHCIT